MKLISVCFLILMVPLLLAQQAPVRLRSNPPVIQSSWDDLLAGVKTADDWTKHRAVLQQRYLELIRDQHKPQKPALDLKVHETVIVEGRYQRLYISYQVESDERAHAYLGIPLELKDKAPAVVALHGTTAEGTRQTAGLAETLIKPSSIISVAAATSSSRRSISFPASASRRRALTTRRVSMRSIRNGPP